jgi:MFS transporter, CP family, cyanate transporter
VALASDAPHVAEAGWRRLTLLWFAGADLRMTLLAVPPLIPIIHDELGLNEKAVAALVSLPVLVLGLGAVPGSLLVARIGARQALLAGLVVIGVAGALRGVGPFTPVLFAMTLLMGVGIAVCQPTILALVRQWFPSRVARATGVWSSGLLIGELLGASLTLTVVMPLVGGSWELALAAWSIPVFLTAAVLAVSKRQRITQPARELVSPTNPRVDPRFPEREMGRALAAAPGRGRALAEGLPRRGGWPDWRKPRLWQLGLLQSSASLIYFGANTFLPDYLHVIGLPDLVGVALTAVNGAQIPAAPLVGLLPWRFVVHPGTIVAGAGLTLAAVGGLISEQPALIVAAGALLGFLSAYVLVVCFAIPPLLADAADVAGLSAGTNTISYSIAFCSILTAGAVWDATQVPAAGFLPVLLGALIVLLIGPRLVSATSRAS